MDGTTHGRVARHLTPIFAPIHISLTKKLPQMTCNTTVRHVKRNLFHRQVLHIIPNTSILKRDINVRNVKEDFMYMLC